MAFTPIKFFDAPPVIDTSVTPIPAASSLPLQVIADSGISRGVGIYYTDSTGSFIGVYIGAAGAETLVCVIGNGISTVAWGVFPVHSRVSLRSMSGSQIKIGKISGCLGTQ